MCSSYFCCCPSWYQERKVKVSIVMSPSLFINYYIKATVFTYNKLTITEACSGLKTVSVQDIECTKSTYSMSALNGNKFHILCLLHYRFKYVMILFSIQSPYWPYCWKFRRKLLFNIILKFILKMILNWYINFLLC